MITNSSDFLGRDVDVIIDRPLGSHHPKHGHLYPVNYGYIPNTLAPDGEELDVYVLGIDVPLERFHGRCIAIIQRLDDDDDKLIVVPIGTERSDAEIRSQTEFQERYFESVLIRPD